jgi:hypothetical protein
MKSERQNSIMLIILRLITVALHFYSMGAMADDSIIAGKTKIRPLLTADEIVKNIRAIVDHGDLADEQYYAEKLGVVMEGGEIGSVTEPDFPCGLGVASKRERMIEQRFYYKDVPWYFTSWFGRNQVCDRPYAKAFLPNGLIEVVGKLMIDTKRICITEDNLRKYFKSGEYFNERGGFRVKYSVVAHNTIYFEAASPSSSPQCAVYVNFYQNRI